MEVDSRRTEARQSSPGRYAGYNPPRWGGWQRISRYVEMADGVRLAVDIYRPEDEHGVCDQPLPAVFAPHRYMRAYETPDGRLGTAVVDVNGFSNFLRHGYCMVVWDPRGAGASFGEYHGLVSASEVDDAIFLVEWIAEQPWCDGNVGMFGRSYSGNVQHVVASRRPRGLKALFPSVSLFDAYDTIFPGGVFRPVVADRMPLLLSSDMGDDLVFSRGLPARTDDDPDALLRDKALAEHRANPRHLTEMCDHWRNASETSFRDGAYYLGQRYFVDDASFGPVNPALRQVDVARNAIPTYIFGGWYDGFTADSFSWFMNIPFPRKIIMGPWAHAEGISDARRRAGLRYEAVESLRWFDFWLKGIDNGILDEPAASIAVGSGPDRWHWIETDDWPLGDKVARRFVCSAGDPANRLVEQAPPEAASQLSFAVDYSATTGRTSRWYGLTAVPVSYPDLSGEDAKGLSFTTEPLADPLRIVGSPVFVARLRSTTPDADIVILLEEVDANGRSTYLSEGILRGSFRTEVQAPWATETGIYHPATMATAAETAPLDAGMATVRIALTPIGHETVPGNRLRITLQGADADNLETLRFDPPPVFTVAVGRDRGTELVLPTAPVTPLINRLDGDW